MRAFLSAFPNTGDLPLIESLGFKGLRFDIRGLDQVLAIRNLAKHPGLTPLAIIGSYELCIPVAEEIARLGRGAIELVNEPNLNGWDPEDWAAFTRACYPAIKVEELHHTPIPVVLGGVSNLNREQIRYWEKALKAGAEFDVLAYHRYQTDRRPSDPLKDYKSRAAEFEAVKKLAGGKPFWNSEWGWHDFKWWSEEQVATFAVEEFKIQEAAGVPLTCYYQITDGPNATNPEDHFGLLRFDKTQKPVARAWAAVLGGKA